MTNDKIGDITKPWKRQFFECKTIQHDERLIRGGPWVKKPDLFKPGEGENVRSKNAGG